MKRAVYIGLVPGYANYDIAKFQNPDCLLLYG
jgi:hypothetical protein